MATTTYDLNSNITHAVTNAPGLAVGITMHHSTQDGLPEWNKRVRTPLRTRNGPKVNGWTRKSFDMSSSSRNKYWIKLWKDIHEHMTSCIHSVFWGGISSPFLATISKWSQQQYMLWVVQIDFRPYDRHQILILYLAVLSPISSGYHSTPLRLPASVHWSVAHTLSTDSYVSAIQHGRCSPLHRPT